MTFDLRDVGYFLRAAELGHVGRTAEALGLSQPAVTKAIGRLERELGLRLFDRTPRGIVPTPAGEAFRTRAERLHAEYEDALRLAGDLRVGSVGLLRVGASSAAADAYVTPALAELLERRPSTRISLSVQLSSQVLAALAAGRLDVAIAPGADHDGPDLLRQPLGDDQIVVVASQRHPLFRDPAPTLAGLARYGWVLPREPLAARAWITDTFVRAGLAPPSAVVEVDHGSADAVTLVARTRLLTLAALPRSRRPWPQPVRRVEVDGLAMRRPFAVFTRRDAYRSPVLEAFVDALRRTSGSPAA